MTCIIVLPRLTCFARVYNWHVFTTDTSLIPLDERCVPERTRTRGKWRDSARFFVHESVYGAPDRAERVSLNLRIH